MKVAFLWAAMFACHDGAASATSANVSLHIEYRRVQAITCKGNRRIRVDLDGKLFLDVNLYDCPDGGDWNGPWPTQPARTLSAAELQRLRNMISESGFFDLPPRVERAGHDGYRDELEISLGPRSHVVIVERAPEPPAFRRVRTALEGFAPR